MPNHRDHRPDQDRPDPDQRTAWEREWDAEHAVNQERRRQRPLLRSVRRGLGKRCPNCGARGTLILEFLKPTPGCSVCGENYSHIRTDDFAPWLSIVVLGHVLLPAAVSVERLWHPPLWLHLLIWVPLAAELIVAFLPRAKGAALGLMWSLGLRGDEHQY